jgi:hypothetical protein
MGNTNSPIKDSGTSHGQKIKNMGKNKPGDDGTSGVKAKIPSPRKP